MMDFAILGMALGALICAVCRVKFSGIELLDRLRTFFKALEHYHHGLLLIIISNLTGIPSLSSFLLGLGTFLIIDEANQDNPFAYGKDTFESSTFIGLILLIILIESLLYKENILVGVVV